MSPSREGKKKILVILTNEAFIPSTGRGGRYPSPPSNPQHSKREYDDFSPSGWTSPLTSIQDPPSLLQNANPDEFTRNHRSTGADIYEIGYFWMKFRKEQGIEMVFASPRGGPIPFDPISIESMEGDDKLKNQLKEEKELMNKLGHTFPISWIRNPEEYDLVLIPGGHECMFDLPEHKEIGRIISRVYENGGLVGAIGHGVSALLNARKEENEEREREDRERKERGSIEKREERGEYLIKGKRITCFTSTEEREKKYEQYLPYNLEEKLKERGARVEMGKPFQPFVISDDRLITGQSWPSIHEFVKKIQEECKKNNK